MKKKLTEDQISEILKILNEAINQGPWDASNFLKVIGKNLQEIRQKFLDHIEGGAQSVTKREAVLREKIRQIRGDQQEIFITIYSSEGSEIPTWERILSNLPRQVISRPIYAKEEDALYFIRSKENRSNEAYVSVFINVSDILPLAPDKIPTDKFGKPLLSLKNRAITVENINRFVHLSGDYVYVKGRLVRK